MNLPKLFHQLIERSIDKCGVYPHQCTMLKNGKLTLAALMLPRTDQVYAQVLLMLIDAMPDELIFGIDRFCKPDQGTTLQDCIAGAHYRDDDWHPFVIEYQHEPRIVKPIEWDNVFWNQAVRSEIRALLNGVRVRKETVK